MSTRVYHALEEPRCSSLEAAGSGSNATINSIQVVKGLNSTVQTSAPRADVEQLANHFDEAARLQKELAAFQAVNTRLTTQKFGASGKRMNRLRSSRNKKGFRSKYSRSRTCLISIRRSSRLLTATRRNWKMGRRRGIVEYKNL